MNFGKTFRKLQSGRESGGIAAVLILALIFSPAGTASCDEGKPGRSGGSFFTEAGILAGYGSGNLPEGGYRPVLLIGHFGVDLRRCFSGLRDHRGTLSLFLEPQANPVFAPSTNYEVGIGVGLQYSYPVCEPLSLYVLGSVGPHFISVVTDKQANGFLFSDVLGAGLYYRLSKDAAIHAGYRFRHMSNADFAQPNGGIDTHMGIVGYSLFFK